MWDLVQQCASAMPREILSNLSNFEVKRVCTAPALAVSNKAREKIDSMTMTIKQIWFEKGKEKRFSFLPTRKKEKRKAITHLAHCLLPDTRANASQKSKNQIFRYTI